MSEQIEPIQETKPLEAVAQATSVDPLTELRNLTESVQTDLFQLMDFTQLLSNDLANIARVLNIYKKHLEKSTGFTNEVAHQYEYEITSEGQEKKLLAEGFVEQKDSVIKHGDSLYVQLESGVEGYNFALAFVFANSNGKGVEKELVDRSIGEVFELSDSNGDGSNIKTKVTVKRVFRKA